MSNRSLTQGEILLCKTVFGSSINYGKVLIYHKSYLPFGGQPNDVAMAPNGNIYFDPAGALYKSDFSKADIHSKALLIHEMTHVWQYQNDINVLFKGMYQREYKYLPFESGKAFKDYKIEQQGDIVRDFFYMLNGRRMSSWPSISVYRALIPFKPVLPPPVSTGKGEK